MLLRLTPAQKIASYAVLVFLVSFVALAWDINRAGIAAAYNDPIARIRAQDEAVIASEAIGVTKDSDWMTPKVMGRPLLLKPPLLVWLSALSIRLLGLSLFSVRLPALLLGAAGVAVVFAWAAHARSMAAGVLGGDAPAQPILANLLATVSHRCLGQLVRRTGISGRRVRSSVNTPANPRCVRCYGSGVHSGEERCGHASLRGTNFVLGCYATGTAS